MSHLLLITGDLATGKSTFAKLLSQNFSIPYFDKDSIKERLGDTIGFKNRAENLKLSQASFQFMKLCFLRFQEQNKDIILEANFRKSELTELKSLIRKEDSAYLFVLRGKETILYSRFQKRLKENRHPVHQINDFETLDGFKKYIYSQRYDDYPFPYIVIEADDFSYQKKEEYLNIVKDFLK